MGLFDVGDDPMGGPMVTPTEMLDPSMAPPFDLGMPQQSSPILTEPREDGGGWQRALMLLMPALLAGVAGPKRPIGQGLAQVAGYMPQLMLQRERMQQQQQQYEAVNAYRQQQIAMREQAEQRQRDTLAQKALTTIGEQVGKFEDRDAYDKYIERTGQTFAMAGYARLGAEQLRRMYPFRPPDTATLAEKALKLYYEQPVVKRRLEKDGPTALINDVITLGKGKDAQRVPVLEAHKLAGQELKVGDDAGIKLEDLQQWPAAVLSAKQQFFDEKKRAPIATDNPEVFERARSLMQNKDDAAADLNKQMKAVQIQNAELLGEVRRGQIENNKRRNTGDLTPAQFNMANKLADDFARDSKDFIARAQSYNTVQAAAKDQSPAGDLSTIFAYMKMLDPGSVVREGEFATAQNTAGVPDRIRNLYNKLINGERLTPRQRGDFVNQARAIYSGSKQRQDAIMRTYQQRAIRAQVPPDMVIMDYGAGTAVDTADAAKASAAQKLGIK